MRIAYIYVYNMGTDNAKVMPIEEMSTNTGNFTVFKQLEVQVVI